jgi:hypothetical protein
VKHLIRKGDTPTGVNLPYGCNGFLLISTRFKQLKRPLRLSSESPFQCDFNDRRIFRDETRAIARLKLTPMGVSPFRQKSSGTTLNYNTEENAGAPLLGRGIGEEGLSGCRELSFSPGVLEYMGNSQSILYNLDRIIAC